MGAPGRVELPTNGLGNRCSIHLSYGADAAQVLSHAVLDMPTHRQRFLAIFELTKQLA